MRTLIVVKPDWVERSDLLLELFSLIKENSLNVVFSRKVLFEEDFWREFYVDHIGTQYFCELIQWMSSSPSFFLVVDGAEAVDLVRWRIVGRGNTGLRGKYQTSELRNVAHASDSERAATREIELVCRSNE